MATTATGRTPKAQTGNPPPSSEFRYKRQKLYREQALAIFDPNRYSWIEATTKSGKTAGCIIWLVEMALAGTSGRNYWWVAPTRAVAKIAFERMLSGLQPIEIRRPNVSELSIALINGVKIWFKSAEEPDALYGEDVYAAVLDECSRMKEGSFHAVRTTLTATKGPIRLIGNVKGRKNWFFKGCRKAEAGQPNHAFHKITWQHAVAAKILDYDEIMDAKTVLPPNVFKELYEAEPADDEGCPFGIEAIRACTRAAFSLNPVAVWGWDLGKHQTWTVGTALDRGGAMVKMVRFQLPWTETKKRIIVETGGKSALVDATGVGDPIAEELCKAGNFTGYVFTPRTKQDLMSKLASDIQQTRLGLTGDTLINELESFEYEYRGRHGAFTGVFYSAPEGMFDDCVCSLGLANWHLGERGVEFRFSRVPSPSSVQSEDDRTDSSAAGVAAAFERATPSWEERGGLI